MYNDPCNRNFYSTHPDRKSGLPHPIYIPLYLVAQSVSVNADEYTGDM